MNQKGSARRDIVLPAYFDKMLSDRMERQGIGRSEAVRSFMREAEANGQRLARFHIKRLASILRLNIAAIRLTPGKLQEALRAMDCTVEEIEKLAE